MFVRALFNAECETGRRRAEIGDRIEREENFLARVPDQRERAEKLPRRARRAERELIEQAALRRRIAAMSCSRKRRRCWPPSEGTRERLAAVVRVLEERRDVAVIAARLAAPRYLAEALGERPTDREGAWLWDRAAGKIERYRQEHGITDPNNALGVKPSDGHGRDSWQEAHRAQQHLEYQ